MNRRRYAQFADTSIEAWCLVASDSDDDKAYFVAKHHGGRITCTCPHYENKLRYRGKLCKHGIKANNDKLFQEV
jgi:hypothetical protein